MHAFNVGKSKADFRVPTRRCNGVTIETIIRL